MTEGENHNRFADEKLNHFYHDYLQHKKHEDTDREHLLKCMHENKAAVEALTKSNDELTKSTAGLVEAWKSANGAVRVGAVIGKFVKWVGGFGFIIYIASQFAPHADKVK